MTNTKREAPKTTGLRLTAARILASVPADTACAKHPAFEATYCPVCGTARRI